MGKRRGGFLRNQLRLLGLPLAILITKGCCDTSSSSSDEGCAAYDRYGDSGTGGTWGTGGHPSGGSGGSGGIGGSGGSVDASFPEDWRLINTWSDCPYWVAEQSPPGLPGLGWEDCGALAPWGHGCSRLGSSLGGYPGTLVPTAAMSFEPGSQLPLIHLQFDQQRETETLRFSLVAQDGGGAVRHALAHVLSPTCDIGPPLLEGKDYAVALAGGTGTGASGRSVEGIVTGNVDKAWGGTVFSVPADEAKSSTWLLTPSWIVRSASTVEARTRDLNVAVTVYDPTELPEVPPGAAVAGVGNVLFLETPSESQASMSVWSPEGGRQPLLLGEDFATDGADMVWTRVTSEPADGGENLSRSLMTAPFSTDASEVQSTSRWLADLDEPGQGRWTVGCRRAARVSFVGDNVDPAILVVDLVDGSVDIIANVHVGAESLVWTSVVGLTCSSIYALGHATGGTNLWKLSVQGSEVDAGVQPDAAMESGADASPDVSLDALPDVSLDAIPDVSLDVAIDVEGG